MIIAIPANLSDEFEETPKVSQNAAYAKYVSSCGFTPVVIPFESDPNVIADMADALLLAGGIDVDPMYYGLPNNGSIYTNPTKDAAERALFHAFRVRGKKVFGICRGMQLIFREYLMSIADSEESKFFDYVENIGGHSQSGGLHLRRCIPSHYVKANMPKLFNTKMAPEYQKLPVNSLHHQACIFKHGALHEAAYPVKPTNVKGSRFPRGFNATEPFITMVGNIEILAWSLRSVEKPKNDKDIASHWCIIESYKIHGWGSDILAVQWHPEELRTYELLANFINADNKNAAPIVLGAHA